MTCLISVSVCLFFISMQHDINMCFETYVAVVIAEFRNLCYLYNTKTVLFVTLLQ